MEGHVSNHCYANIVSQYYSKSAVLPKNNILSSVYNKYRRLVRYSEDYVKQMYVSDTLENCLACEDAERIMITMDGNFQMKRLDDKSQE
ncbi:hypothetical protein A0J61_11463 [Choanephora cucurbitarum]|uniref:Uncharacterized protein n=1 Tax=Choanephora cucurbitarum TaxID=101091 RepID=A0A1C7MUL0_9FUNG|nr:hypothetical protein A0J61_11463 [Choanephora cucurbitarum]